MTESIVSVAGGYSQLELIRSIKSLGYNPIVVDRDPEAPGRELASEFINESTHNVEEVGHSILSMSNSYDIKAVVTGSSGQPVVTAAHAAEQIDAVGPDMQLAEASINKTKFNDLCNRVGLRTPKRIKESIFQEDTLPFPVIVKPDVTKKGKDGIRVIKNKDSLEESVEGAKRASYNGRVCIEEYVSGKDFILPFYVHDNQVSLLAVVREHIGIDESGHITGLGTSIDSDSQRRKSMLKTVQNFVEEFSLNQTFGVLSIRVQTGSDPYIIEYHAEFVGDMILDALIPSAIDYNPFSQGLHAYLGEKPRSPPDPKKHSAVYLLMDSETNNQKIQLVRSQLKDNIKIITSTGSSEQVGILVKADNEVSLSGSLEFLNDCLNRSSTMVMSI